MASSDDEGEIDLKNVSDYEFLSDSDSICFSKLPIVWDGSESHGAKIKEIFVSGKADNGLMKIYKEVLAWKFELPRPRPEISVLSTEGHWIKLLKPRNIYFQDIIRKIQITLHFLHFVKWNPQQSEKALWDYLTKTFSMFEKRPCEDDLVDYMPLINEVVERNEVFRNSKLLGAFLNEKPRRRNIFNKDLNPSFIVDDVDGESEPEDLTNEVDEDEPDDDDCFDSVCAICDNGGLLFLCEGKCIRSFHPTVEDGEESNCESLGFTEADLEAMKNVSFYCKNCDHKQHQCFSCGELGSSDEDSGAAEVFRCVNGACGHFYHPSCVAKLLHPNDRAARAEHEKKIAAGEQFVCPAHKCFVCKELEVRSNEELQFAVCRRCPRSYHRKCLPRAIAFEEDVDDSGNIIIQRAWEKLIPNRILIYCLEHEIDSDMDTPARDHIKFPGIKYDKKKSSSIGVDKNKDMINKRGLVSEDIAGKKISAKPSVKVVSSSKQGEPFRKIIEKLPVDSSKKLKLTTNRTLGKSRESTNNTGQTSLGNMLYTNFFGMDSEPEKSNKGAKSCGDQERTQKVQPAASRVNTSVTLDIESQKRILALMKDVSSSITLDQIRKKHKPPSTHSQYSKFHADNITKGKLEGTIQALRAALKKLDEGGNVVDAKAVCGNDLLLQVFKWNERFKVYLAPFLYGMRYTSFGRHFTKTDKLEEVVDILHWYIQENDMLVDFCCGANEFSTLAKKKLDEVGKSCLFKNYDILQPKDDFCFERRDWMSVRPNELPNGSQLIMGLNPPFGINAALANKFINKALEFKPKLIVLIVPQETQRLDEKECPYDLIFEDDQMFGGRSFYLPGSVDVNDKQIEDWNVKPPVLYLWSHPDWTVKHKAIAEKYGHFPGARKKESHNEIQVSKSPEGCENQSDSNASKDEDTRPIKPKTHKQKAKAEQKVEAEQKIKTEQKGKATPGHLEGSSPHNSNGSRRGKSGSLEKNPNYGGKASKPSERRKRERQLHNHFPEDNRNRKKQFRFSHNSPHARQSVPRHPSPSIRGRGSVEAYSPGLMDAPTLQVNPSRDSHSQFNQRNFSTYQQQHHLRVDRGYSGNSEPPRIYSLNGEEDLATTISRYTYAPSPRPEFSLRASTERWIGHEERGSGLPHYVRAPPYNLGEAVNSGFRAEPIYLNPNQQGVLPQPYHAPGFPGQLHPQGHALGFPGQVHQVHAPMFPGHVHYQVQVRGMSHSSTMDRYASHLGVDQVNHSPAPDASGMHRNSGPRPVNHQIGSLGFAPAPPGSYSHHGSSGWLHE